MLAAQLFQSQHIPYLLRFNSFVSVVEESVLLPPRHSWLRSTCTKRNRMNDMVSETFVSGFDLCTIFLPFHSSNAKKRKRIQKYGICILFLVFLWLFPFFSIYIYISLRSSRSYEFELNLIYYRKYLEYRRMLNKMCKNFVSRCYECFIRKDVNYFYCRLNYVVSMWNSMEEFFK